MFWAISPHFPHPPHPIPIPNFASYQLWSQFEPALSWEDTHCQMQRGFRWPQAKSSSPTEQGLLVQETIWQKVGKLAQQSVYEFHQNPLWLKHPRGCERVADRIYLYYEIAVVRDRVMKIIQQYQASPFLFGRDIIVLNRGDEQLPQPIKIQVDNYSFQLFAAFDCIVQSPDLQLQIIDCELPTVKRVRYDGGFWLRGGSPHSCLSTSTWSYISSTSSLASS